MRELIALGRRCSGREFETLASLALYWNALGRPVDCSGFARIRLGIMLPPFGPARRPIWLVTLAVPKGSRPPLIYVSDALLDAQVTRPGRAAEELVRCQAELATLPGLRWRGRQGRVVVDDHVDPTRVKTLCDTMEALLAAEEAAALPAIEMNAVTTRAVRRLLDGCETGEQAILNRIMEGWQSAGQQVSAVRGGGVGLYVQVGDQSILLAHLRAGHRPRADAIDTLAQQMLSGGGGMVKGSDLLQAAEARKKAGRDGRTSGDKRGRPTISFDWGALRGHPRLSPKAVAAAEATVNRLIPTAASRQGASAIPVADALTPEAIEQLLAALAMLALHAEK
jgi:hypothetical protein